MSGYATIPVGGGGFVTGLDFSSDGLTNLCRTDTAGAYILSGGLWVQLCTSARFGTSTPSTESGVIEIASAPSDSTIIYMYYSNKVFKSTDRGASFTACSGWNSSWAAAANDANGVRLMGRKMAIDPVNPNCVIVCPQDSSAPPKITTDGGTTWASVPTIAAALAYCVVFDTSGGTTGGSPNFTKNIFIAPRSSQMYRSTDAGSTFALTSGGPTAHVHMVTSNGIIWATDGGVNSLWKYVVSTNTWSSVTGIGMGGNPVHCVAVDPTNSSHIVLVNEAGDVQSSINSGGAWGSLFNGSAQTIPAGQPGWLGYTSNYGMSAGDAVFESTGTTIYFGAGVGAWTLPPASPVHWSCLTAGIENLTSVGIVSPPGSSGHPVLVSWDRQVQYISDLTSYPSQNAVNTSFNFGWHVDYSQVDTMMVALINHLADSSFDFSSYSTDNGQTWTTMPSLPHVKNATTSVAATTGHQLTFASAPAVHPGMYALDSTTGYNVAFAGDTQVISTNGTTTVDIAADTTAVGSGDNIRFRDGPGGSVAVSTNSNWMWLPSNNSSYPYYTTDGGTTWHLSALPSTAAAGATPVAFSGTHNTANGQITSTSVPANQLKVGWTYIGVFRATLGVQHSSCTISSIDGANAVTVSTNGVVNGTDALVPTPSGWGNAYYDNTVMLCADSVTANKFYLYNTITGLCYVSTDSGATFTAASSSLAGTLGDQEVLLKNVPGKAGHLFLCAGNGAFMRSSNSGATWASVPNMSSIATFGFGKPKSGGGGYPIILATGKYLGAGSGNRIWRSDDGDQATPTWFEPTTGAATGLLDSITRLDGDKNIEDQFYFSWHGSSGGVFLASSSLPSSNVFGFSVVHDHGRRHTKMIGY